MCLREKYINLQNKAKSPTAVAVGRFLYIHKLYHIRGDEVIYRLLVAEVHFKHGEVKDVTASFTHSSALPDL